jgi:hypothetical protein
VVPGFLLSEKISGAAAVGILRTKFPKMKMKKSNGRKRFEIRKKLRGACVLQKNPEAVVFCVRIRPRTAVLRSCIQNFSFARTKNVRRC